MLTRFCLYGFLKNLRLFEAFLLLALLDRGLDFATIGGLIAVREVTVNLCEVPSGALADGFGRKRCMVVSMAAYVVAYVILGLTRSPWALASGMLAYGVGDAFRSGTHKALIFTWLRQQGREDERTQVYGYTRSWSKLGSACSALLGGAVLLAGLDYRWIFLASAVPAALNLLNLATYPSSLDHPSGAWWAATRRAWQHLGSGLRAVVRRGPQRRLVVGSMVMEGGHATIKDYLQPVLQTLALSVPLGLGLDDTQRTGVVVGVVSALSFFLASAASRRAHRVESACGGDDAAAQALLRATGLSGVALLATLWLGWASAAALVFMALAVLINLWRPIHVGRFDRHGDQADAATVLSVEAQAKALTAALLAPALGLAVDRLAGPAHPVPTWALWPVSVVAIAALLPGLRRARPVSSAT